MKILIWDIETLPLVVTSWGLYDQRLSHDNIIQDSSIICASWKWFGEKETNWVAINPATPTNDLEVITRLHDVISQADVLVGHNGDKFDLRIFKARALAHRLKPLPNLQTIDTLKVAKKVFRFTSNRLDYLGRFLGVGKKIRTDYSLWLNIMKGSQEDLDKMVRYNIADVLLLEKVYKVLRPYITNHPNTGLYEEGTTSVCPICGGRVIKRGFKYQRTTKRQQYQCRKCGGYSSGKLIKTVGVS